MSPEPITPKPWYQSKVNIAALLTLLINLINVALQSPLIPPQALAVISGFVLPTIIFVLRTWFTDSPTTAPFGVGKS
jgi:hypothetical protein